MHNPRRKTVTPKHPQKKIDPGLLACLISSFQSPFLHKNGAKSLAVKCPMNKLNHLTVWGKSWTLSMQLCVFNCATPIARTLQGTISYESARFIRTKRPTVLNVSRDQTFFPCSEILQAIVFLGGGYSFGSTIL